MLNRITDLVLGHRLIVGVVWLVLTALSLTTISSTVGRFSQEFTVPGREGAETSGEILRTYGNGGGAGPLVVVTTLPEGRTADDPAVAGELTTLFDQIRATAPTARVVDYGSTGDRMFVSADGRTVYGLVFVPPGEGFGPSAEIGAVQSLVQSSTVAGTPVMLTSYDLLQDGGGSGDEGSTLVETLISALGALIILLWVFGSALALIPLVVAGVAILATFLVLGGIAAAVQVSFIVEFIVALIGLGVAIDYSLVIVTRWREERDGGATNIDAVRRSIATAGSAVVFSGVTVAVSLLALVVLPVPILRSIGYAGLLIPLISVVVSLTLLPVILATVGPALDRKRFRRGGQESRAWAWWGRLVVRRRWVAAAIGLLLLGALLIPATALRIGDPEVSGLPTSGAPAQAAQALVDAGIGVGPLLPYEILAPAADRDGTMAQLGSIDGVLGAASPPDPMWQRADTAVITVVPSVDANSDEGAIILDRVRDAAHALPGAVRVGGPAALDADFIDAVYGSFPLMLGLIAIVTFLLLARAFRSLLLPLKAIVLNVLNVLSVAATYGILVLIWQDGVGTQTLFGVDATGSITSFIPLVVFAFLFGLSMDYEVFILARTREEYDATGDTDAAIVRSLSFTGRLVTSAALILFLAFITLGATPAVLVKVLATGLAAGILLDATIVRALLVPATVSLLGKWNWWLPGWLDRRLNPSPPRTGGSMPAGRLTEPPTASLDPGD